MLQLHSMNPCLYFFLNALFHDKNLFYEFFPFFKANFFAIIVYPIPGISEPVKAGIIKMRDKLYQKLSEADMICNIIAKNKAQCLKRLTQRIISQWKIRIDALFIKLCCMDRLFLNVRYLKEGQCF